MKKMPQLTVATASNSRYEITATAVPCGDGWNITVCGGTQHHVGAMAVGFWHNSTLQIHSFPLPSHRDDLVAEMFAACISNCFRCQTAVTAGIHIDNASQEEISILLQNSYICCELLICELQKAVLQQDQRQRARDDRQNTIRAHKKRESQPSRP